MDDQRFGAAMRAARVRRGWRQDDVAAAAGVSQATIWRIEKGHLGHLSVATLRAVASALDVRIELLPRSRGADLDRLLNARHAGLGEVVVRRFSAVPGWALRPEVSFAWFGERGVIDLLGWHAASRSLLVIELKTAIVDVGEILATLDRKRRLAHIAAESVGWRDLGSVSIALLVADGTTNRRHVAAHRQLFRSSFPDDGRQLTRWLRTPRDAVAVLSFVPDTRPRSLRSGLATPSRVRRRPIAKADPLARTSRLGAGSSLPRVEASVTRHAA